MTFSRKLFSHYRGRRVSNPEDAENRLADFMNELEAERDNVIGLIIFSRSPNPDIWTNRLADRIEEIRNLLIEDSYEQLDNQGSDADEQLRKDAEAFGTDVETWLDFLAAGFNYIIDASAKDKERARSYVDLRDVINDWQKLVGFVRYVRFSGERFFVSIQDSGGRRRQARRKRKKKTRK